MTKLFGTDGIRGEAGKFPLDPATVRVIGASLAKHLAEQTNGRTPRIVVGRDTRESGPAIERAIVAGARETGAEIESAGVITTPGVAYLTRNLPADAGIVISASHNPYYDNGIKVFEPSGRKLNDDVERRIEADVASDAESERPGLTTPESAAPSYSTQLASAYVNHLVNEIGRDLSLANLTIVIDCANGAAYRVAPDVLRRLGARIIAINDQPDGRNINRDSGSLHIEGLQKRVVEEKANVGVAFDGDADRALFVDATGNFVDGDATLWVLGNYLKDRGELTSNAIVATVMSNLGLEIALRAQGITLVRTDVGDKYVLEELLRTGASLGGEQSGHIIFPKLSLAGDGIITTIELLRVMRERQQPLTELVSGFQRYPQLLVNVRVREKRPFEKLLPVRRLAREIEESLGDRGRLLLRYSGTEPLARVMIEGEDERQIRNLANELADAIRRELGAHDS